MQTLRWGCVLVLVAGCGGHVTEDAAQAPPDCAYGKIADVALAPITLASANGTIYAVFSGTGRNDNTLSAITKDGAKRTLAVGVDVDIVAVGSSLGFIHRVMDAQGQAVIANVNLLAADGTVKTVDQLDSATYQLDSLSSDASGELDWYRWSKNAAPQAPASIGRYRDGSPSSDAIEPGSQDVFGLVHDDSGFYASFTNAGASAVGRLPVDGSPALALASSTDVGASRLEVVGIDDATLVYAAHEDGASAKAAFWSIAKNGGTPSEIVASAAPIGRPFLRDHQLYWVDSNTNGTQILRASTQAVSTPQVVVTEPAAIEAMTVDSCGLVYSTTGAGGSGAIYRTQL